MASKIVAAQKLAAAATQEPPAEIDPRLQAKVAPVLSFIRDKCLRRGPDGILYFTRALEARRESRVSFRVTPEAFRAALTDCGVLLPLTDSNLVVLCFKDDQGFVPIARLTENVTGHLNDARRALVNEIFDSLDVDGSGALQSGDLIQLGINFADHPKVKGGVLTVEEAAQEFIDAFDNHGFADRDGKITRNEFLAYFGTMSFDFPTDKSFESCLRKAWEQPLKAAKARREAAAGIAALQQSMLDAARSPTKSSTMLTKDNLSSSRSRSTSPKNHMAAAKRIVGYTGHVPMARERFGETFHRIEAATPDLGAGRAEAAAPWQNYQPGVQVLDPSQGIVRAGNKANKHSFKLA